MKYDYICQKCQKVFEIEKKLTDPPPSQCPHCRSKKIERHFSSDSMPAILYPNRPPWTYREALKYKTARWNGGPLTKIDPKKHGDLGSWNSPGEVVPEKKKGKRK
jgi:putative FmdB family regulatory protein